MRFLKNLSREQLVFAAVVTIAPLLLCGFMFGFDIPLASAKFWSLPKSDMISMTGGYEAFIHQPWTFPLTMVSGLLPKPVSIVFTDSIPWLAILLKASGLGRFFNPLGVFLMLSYPLQAWGMIALLRSLGVRDRAALLIGAAFALMYPTWLARQFGHIALAGHWLILFALALSISSARFGLTAKRVGGFVALAVLATGIHAYHLAPIGACFGAALLAELAQKRLDAWKRVPVAAVAMLSALALSALLLGYGEGAAAAGGADAIGYFSMNALGPVWPEASNVFGQHWMGSWYYHTLDPSGGQSFEGFQFMGVGCLLLVAVMLGLLIRDLSAGRRPESGFWTRWAPLVLAMAFLAAWAVGWAVYVGPKLVANLPKPSGKLADAISVYRAHGRFFWAPGYLILALAINWASRLPKRVAFSLLGVALAVQAFDSSPLRQGVRSVFATPDTSDMPAGFATAPALRGRVWVFHPTFFCSASQLDIRGISQMNLLAIRTGGVTNTYATARSNDAPCDQAPPDLTLDAAPGDRRITVVMSDGRGEGGLLAPIAQRSDCYRIRRGAMCGRDLAGIPGLTPVPRGELNATRTPVTAIHLDRPLQANVLVAGWSPQEPGAKGIWTVAHKALFNLDAPASIGANGYDIEVVAIGFSDPPMRPQRVTLQAEGHVLETKMMAPGLFDTYRFHIPAGVARPGQTVRFMFDLPDARTSVDPRLLGIAVQEIRVLQ